MNLYLEIENAIKRIKGKIVLDHISLEMEKGKIYGLRGINGSGKTMLMRAIAGLLHLTEGKVMVAGKTIGKEISFPESLGLFIESPAFISRYTGHKNLLLLAELKEGIATFEVEETLKNVGLDPGDRRTYRKYSLGMKQRLGIACALMEHPELILLDEPFNALDESGVAQIRELIIKEKERGALIILSCHDQAELESLSDEIFYMRDGKILS